MKAPPEWNENILCVLTAQRRGNCALELIEQLSWAIGERRREKSMLDLHLEKEFMWYIV